MAYVNADVKVNETNFLASSHYISFTKQVDSTNYAVVTGKDGRKVVPAGSVYPTNDAKAIGITLDEVDVTNGSQPVPVIVEGYIKSKALPKAPDATAITALKEIKFVDKTAE